MKGIHLIYIILPIMLLIAWQQVRAASLRDQLVLVKGELSSKRQQLAQIRVKKTITIKRISQNGTDQQILAGRINKAEKEILSLQSVITEKQKKISDTVASRQQRERLRQERAVEIYKLLVLQDDVTSMQPSATWSAISMVCLESGLIQDREVIKRQTAQINSLESRKSILQAGKKKQEVEKTAGRKEHARLELDTKQQKKALAGLAKDQEKINTEIKEYEAQQQRLKSLLARITKFAKKPASRTAKGGGGASADSGFGYRPGPPLPDDFAKFNLPVNGKIIRSYGVYRHPQWQTSTFSSGLTIAADAGSTVKAIHSGSIVYSGSLKGYGNIIIIDHSKQVFSVYAHCGSMMKKTGSRVERGETVATVSAADGEDPSLYFELRSRGKAVNPSRWIAA